MALRFAPERGRGFVSDGQSSTVTIFDLKTLKPIADVPTGKKPDAIIYDPATSKVFAFNGGSDSATAIDAATGKVAGTVDLGGGPEFAAADGNGFVYDNPEDESLVLKIDSRTLKVEQRWPTAPCASPSSMAMDRANRRLFLGCRSKVMAVMNADTGQVITTLPIGDHVDATAFDLETKLIFNSNGEGTVTVIHQEGPDKYSVVETVKTLPRAKTMALDPKTHQLFLATAEAGQFEALVVEKYRGAGSSVYSSMTFRRRSFPHTLLLLCAGATLLGLTGCTKKSSAQTSTVDLQLKVSAPFRFVAYGILASMIPKIRRRRTLRCVWRWCRPSREPILRLYASLATSFTTATI